MASITDIRDSKSMQGAKLRYLMFVSRRTMYDVAIGVNPDVMIADIFIGIVGGVTVISG